MPERLRSELLVPSGAGVLLGVMVLHDHVRKPANLFFHGQSTAGMNGIEKRSPRPPTTIVLLI